MKKAQVQHLLTLLPEEFKTEELIEKLLFVKKAENGLKAAKEGKTIPSEEVKKRLKFI